MKNVVLYITGCFFTISVLAQGLYLRLPTTQQKKDGMPAVKTAKPANNAGFNRFKNNYRQLLAGNSRPLLNAIDSSLYQKLGINQLQLNHIANRLNHAMLKKTGEMKLHDRLEHGTFILLPQGYYAIQFKVGPYTGLLAGAVKLDNNGNIVDFALLKPNDQTLTMKDDGLVQLLKPIASEWGKAPGQAQNKSKDK